MLLIRRVIIVHIIIISSALFIYLDANMAEKCTYGFESRIDQIVECKRKSILISIRWDYVFELNPQHGTKEL